MTTIVCTRQGMASDSMASDGITSTSVTKIKRIHGCLVGVAGVFTEANKFFNWLENADIEEDIPVPDMEHVSALVLTSKGDIMLYDHSLSPYFIDSPFTAIGSGSAAALAAMHCGKTLKDAVKIAILIDPFSGGKVVQHNLDPVKVSRKKVVDYVET